MADLSVYPNEPDTSTDDTEDAPPPVGVLSSMTRQAPRTSQVYEDAIKRLRDTREQRGLSSEQLFAIAAALGKKTATGSWGESMGNLGETLGKISADRRTAREGREDAISALRLKQAEGEDTADRQLQEWKLKYETPKPVPLAVNSVTGEVFNPYTGKVVIPGVGYRPGTQDGVKGQYTPNGEFKPYSKEFQPGGKTLPAPIQKMEETDITDINVSAALRADIKAAREQMENEELKLGPVENVIGSARNFLGVSDPESVRLASLKALIEKMRNDSLRLNKGAQTEGDATRALNQILKSLNDPKVVKQRFSELDADLARRLKSTTLTIQRRRAERGVAPINMEDYLDVAAAYGSADPYLGAAKSEAEKRKTAQSTGGGVKVETLEEANALKPGTVFITPDGKRKIR